MEAPIAMIWSKVYRSNIKESSKSGPKVVDNSEWMSECHINWGKIGAEAI